MKDSTSRTATGTRTEIVISRFGARSSCAGSVIAAGALAILFWLGGSQAALAQKAATQAGSSDELRPLNANAMDVEEGKHLAQTTCSNCHGAEGISTTAGVPNLAGQRSVYLYRELRAYVSGGRNVGAMNDAVKFLSTDALIDVAAYYASLDPAQPAAASDAKGVADPAQAGKAAAAGCASCHGETGISKTPGTPSLVGLDPKYLVAAMAAYKGGQRKNDIMKAMIAPVAEANLNNIALFYALQKPAPAQTAAAGSPTAGQALAAACAGCHGAQGVSGNPATPSLAGQDAQYLAAALHGYQDGSRSDATMKGLAAGLDDATIKNLAAYYASLQPRPPAVPKSLTAAQWAERCNRCHGVNGNSADPRVPALAAQRADYLEKVLGAYRSGARRSPEMAAMAEVLSENDIKNLAAYYARQKARAVVYVPIPTR
jgi:cytochrome c553